MNILGIGELVIDKTYTIQDTIVEGGKIQPQSLSYSLGGPVASALCLLSNLGASCNFVGTIGEDYKDYIEETFAKFGVKTNFIIAKATKVNTILVNKKNGTRTIIRDVEHNEKIKKIDIDLIKKADFIIFDRHEKDAFDFVLKHKKDSTKIIIDPSNEFGDRIIKMLKNSYIPIFPIEILDNVSPLSREENLKILYDILQKNFIITDGKNGSYLYDGKKKVFIKAEKNINVVDTNGAGDVFRGAFTYGVLKGWDIEKIIEFSNIVAALQCEKPGNISAIPSFEDIKNYISKYKKNFNL